MYYNKQVQELQEANRYMELEKRIDKIEKVIGNWKESPEFSTMSTTIDFLYQMTQHINPSQVEEKIKNLQEAIAELKKCLAQKGEEKYEFDKGEVRNKL